MQPSQLEGLRDLLHRLQAARLHPLYDKRAQRPPRGNVRGIPLQTYFHERTRNLLNQGSQVESQERT